MASDILFQNNDICILKPDSPRGIVVFTRSKSTNICTEGILSYNELRLRHPELGLTDRYHHDLSHDDLIFFRAPYNSDTSTFETSYDRISAKVDQYSPAIALIKIDPNNTFVYLSEARSEGSYQDLLNSRISMRNYLDNVIPVIKRANAYSLNDVYDGILSRSLIQHLKTYGSSVTRFFEVVAKIPHIPTEWLVSCEVYNGPYRSGPGSATSAPPPPPEKNYEQLANAIIGKLSTLEFNDSVTITTQFYNPNIIRITFNNGPYKNFKYLVYFSIKLPEKIFSGNTQDIRAIDIEKINEVLTTFGGKRRNKSRRFKRLRRFTHFKKSRKYKNSKAK